MPPEVRRVSWTRWAARAVAAAAGVLTGWVLVTAWGAVVHGHPAYAVMLALTAVGALLGSWWAWQTGGSGRRGLWRGVATWVGLVLAVAWVALIGWLRPFTAGADAVSAMESDQAVSVRETATQIVLSPATGDPSALGVFFQPGARVDARAYVPGLRALAEDGHTVVIVKQPLGIAFTALGALDSVRPAFGDVTSWVVGGHSLGGTVAAMEAVSGEGGDAPVVGLFFWASYPADSIRETFDGAVASISGSRDGLATPAKIEESKADLPDDTVYTVVDGASHAQFGDYGVQPGDNTPTISAAEARDAIAEATVGFVETAAVR